MGVLEKRFREVGRLERAERVVRQLAEEADGEMGKVEGEREG